MFRPLALFLGLRYTRAKRRNGFISVISLFSILGVAVGVTALITVLSVMNGFEKELRDRILGMASHAIITTRDERLEDWERIASQALEHPDVVGIAPYVRGEVMLSANGNVSGSLLRGVNPAREPAVSDIQQYLDGEGLAELAAGEYRLLIGRELARVLDVVPGDRVTVITPEASYTAVGVIPRVKRFTVADVFEVGMHDYDRGLVLVHIDDASRLLRLGEGVTGVRLKLDDLFKAPRVVREIAIAQKAGLWISDWTRQHANFFRAIQMEKTAMFVILTLIVAVAAFNIISTLVMVVTDKQSDIAVLRTLGASPASIMRVFIVQGTLIGLLGTALGVLGGVSLASNVETLVPWIEQQFRVDILPGDVYYLTELPSQMLWSDVGRISGVAFGLSVLATLYPAWRAARTQPVEALRYE